MQAMKASAAAKQRLAALTAEHEADKRSAVTWAQKHARQEAELRVTQLEEEYKRRLQEVEARNNAALAAELHRLQVEKDTALETVRADLMTQHREQEMR